MRQTLNLGVTEKKYMWIKIINLKTKNTPVRSRIKKKYGRKILLKQEIDEPQQSNCKIKIPETLKL